MLRSVQKSDKSVTIRGIKLSILNLMDSQFRLATFPRQRSDIPRAAMRPSVFMILLLALAASVKGQAPGTGAISGLVSDLAGKAISKAEVRAVNEATQASRTVLTTTDGVFRVTLLSPGNYSVTVSAAGFAEHNVRSVPVTVSETSYLDLKLTIAGVSASVEVTSEAQIAQTESSTLGRAVEQQAIETLPLANRNYTQILGLSPGVVVALPDATELGRGTQNVTSNGAKTTSNNVQFNGIDANNLSQDSAANDGEEVGTRHSRTRRYSGVQGADRKL
jgi:hypothetical protein